jgi:hypothetical protein
MRASKLSDEELKAEISRTLRKLKALRREERDRMIKFILTYESDTFSASGEDLKPKDARKILSILKRCKIADPNRIDGVALHEAHWEQIG